MWLKILLSLTIVMQIWLMISSQGHQHQQQHQLVAIRTRGFWPFESYVLPYAIIQRITEQQRMRAGRQLQPTYLRATVINGGSHQPIERHPQHPAYPAYPAFPTRNARMRFQRSAYNPRVFKLYDDDGEYLLDVNYHRY